MRSRPDPLTVVKGDGWRKYVGDLPRDRVVPIGTVKMGTQIEGALILDLKCGLYMLIDNSCGWHELDQEKVRAALESEGGS